jgi:hypothetical protein
MVFVYPSPRALAFRAPATLRTLATKDNPMAADDPKFTFCDSFLDMKLL